MPSVGVCIMGHPKREGSIRRLVASIDRRDIRVVWDTTSNVYDTGRRAWLEGVGSGFTHWLVLQDDAKVCKDLVDGIEAALPHIHPPSPLSLYIGKPRPFADRVQMLVDKANIVDPSFIVTNRLNWGVGFVVPVTQIASMVDFCDRRSDKMYDRRMSVWFLDNNLPVYSTWPSLVDHIRGPSLLGARREDRHAHRFIGEGESALGVDWSKGVVAVKRSKSRRVP